MSGFSLLDLVKVFLPILPEIELPLDNVSLDEKVVFTVASALIFLLSQLPLYGLVVDAYDKIADPFSFSRAIFAQEKATLLELGVLPVVTASLVWQLAAGLRLIKVNFTKKSDRELFQTGQKLTSIVLAAIYAVGLIASGYYDNAIRGYDATESTTLPLNSYIFIFGQIVGGSFFVTLMVEIFDKGYGFGSGALAFIALLLATDVIENLLSFDTYLIPGTDNETKTRGAIVHVLKALKDFNFIKALEPFTRSDLPNFGQIAIVVGSLLVVIALQNFRIELPIRSTKVRGMANVFPIRLLYTGALPVVFAYAYLANVQFFGYAFVTILNKYTDLASYTRFIGSWDDALYLKGGILYFFSPAQSFIGLLILPIRTSVYFVTVVILSTWFANTWSGISGSAPKDIAKQFKEQGITISSRRDESITKELSRVIPVASVSGAFLLATLSVVGDVLGGQGRGVAAVIGISAAFAILEEFMMEFQQSGGASQFGNILKKP